MIIADNIIKDKLKNIYFIWGSGKTVTANALGRKYGIHVYHTDNRGPLFARAVPKFQNAMCQDVPDYWALPKEDALAWEKAIVQEMTPMILCDLIELSGKYERIICEGDIDIDGIIHVVSNAVTIVNQGSTYDFFDRPEQKQMLDNIKARQDIDEPKKQELLKNAYAIVSTSTIETLPKEVQKYGVKAVFRNEATSVEDVANMIAHYWKL